MDQVEALSHALTARRRTAIATLCVSALFAGAAGTAEAASPCSISSPSGERTVPLSDQGQDRPFLLHVPAGYDGHERLPLVLNLHPTGGDGSGQMETSEFAEAADAKNVAVAAPNGAVDYGNGHAWNVPGVPLVGGDPVPAGTPDDERYLLRVIRKAKQTLCIAPKRVFFTGYSGGARMTSQMACDHADVIAAIAPVAGLRSGVPKQGSSGAWQPDRSTCKPTQPVPLVTFHGTADTTNPYEGNDDPRWGYSVERALARWARIDRCRKGPKTEAATPTVDLIEYSDCRNKASVQLFRAEGAGHTWPGSTQAPGQTDQTMSATNRMISFFKKHPLIRSK